MRDRTGELVAIDDSRADPIWAKVWAKAGELGIRVAIHVADPDAFLRPVDRFNERWRSCSGGRTGASRGLSYLETYDEYFDCFPSPTPPQGRWRIYGIGLPDDILEKVYRTNARRLLRLN